MHTENHVSGLPGIVVNVIIPDVVVWWGFLTDNYTTLVDLVLG